MILSMPHGKKIEIIYLKDRDNHYYHFSCEFIKDYCLEEMMRVVDARGRPCPQPVLMTRSAMEEGIGELTVMVDNEGSAENVKRFAGKSG